MKSGEQFSYNPKKAKHPLEKPIKNPWQAKEKHLLADSKMQLNTFNERFDSFVMDNFGLDLETKIAALNIARSVVSIKTSRGKKSLFKGSGTVVTSSDIGDNMYESTILTSTVLLLDSASVPHDIKVEVCLYNGKVYDGEVFAFDLHFNIALIKVKSAATLSTATIVKLDDTISLDPSLLGKIQLHKPSESFNISPGDKVIAMGRFHEFPYKLMGASGDFSLACCYFDCAELLRSNCKISKCGTGGPLLNRYGEVIGVNFYEEIYTPFLPTNIVSKCLEQFKIHGRFFKPWIGLKMINLYAASLEKLDRVVHKFPGTFTGVFVEEVISGSPAAYSGIRPGDVISRCNGRVVQSFLQLSEMILDYVEGVLEVGVLREETGEEMNLSIHVTEAAPYECHCWPIPEERWTITDYR